MTMQPLLINGGNRTADTLTIESVNEDGSVSDSKVLHRGEVVDISRFMGWAQSSAPLVRIYAAHGDNDEYVDHPQVLVVDAPKRG